MKKMNKKLISVLLAVMLVFSTMPFGGLTAQADDLSDAKTAYLSKVSQMYAYDGNGNGKLYKNALPAYLAYVEACKDGAGADEAAALVSATNAMEEFTPYTGGVDVKINGSTGSYSSNVVYSEEISNIQYTAASHGYIYYVGGLFDSLKYGSDWFIYQPSAVVLYDGKTDAKVPVVFAEQENEGRYDFRFGFVSETGGRLADDWRGHSTSPRDGTSQNVNITWPSSTTYLVPKDSSDESRYWDAADSSSEAGGHGTYSDFYNFKNSLKFTVDNGASYVDITDKNAYKGIANYKKYSKFEWNVKAYWGNLVTGNEHLSQGNNTIYTSNPVYVINYKKLLDKITQTVNTKKDTYLVDGDSFQSGNSVGYFGTFDSVLGLDFTDTSVYDYAADTETAVQKAGLAIDDGCNDLDAISSTAAAMSSIVSNINKYEAMMAENPYRYNLAETYKLYIKAKECFDAFVFGQKNDPDTDADFLSYVATVANEFDTAISSYSTFASYTEDAQGNKTYTADPLEGNYTPDENERIFENDTNGGTTGLAVYKNSGAMTNVLYYPTVTRANGVRAETDTVGGSNHTYTVDGRSMPFNGDGDGTNHFTIYYPAETVLLYNGNKAPSFPVMATIRNAHSSGGVENYTTAAYPTDSTTLYNLSSRYLGNVAGYESHDGKGDGYYPYLSSYNTQSSTKGPHAPAESANFNIKTFASRYTYESQYATNNKYWKGVYTENDKNNLPLNWIDTWNTVTSGISGSGAIYGSPTEWWSRYYDLKADDNHGKAEIALASSALELVANPFAGKVAGDNGYYTANYAGPNWYHSWQEVRFTTDLNVEVMLDKGGSNIRVLNVVPAQEAKQDLLDNNSVQDILNAIFQYDKDSADVVKFLTALDAVGSFNPNNEKYKYGQTVSGDVEYSTNAGIEQACKDMAAMQQSVTDALNYIDESETSDNPTVDDNKVNKPTDKESKSTDTTDPGDGWYGDLRTALLNPLEPDACTDDDAYATYKAVLDKAQDAVSYSAMSKINGEAGSDYASTYNDETIQDIAEELVAATETFKNAPAKHAYLYEDENAEQIATWDCTANASHVHATADMSAYNELAIAYDTIDVEEGYDAESEAAMKTAKTESFDPVKTVATAKGQTPQDYVDDGVIDLLEAINTAAEQQQGEDSHLSSYNVTFKVVLDGTEYDVPSQSGTYVYGAKPTFNAESCMEYLMSNGKCFKWTVTTTGGVEQTMYHVAGTLSCMIQRDCTIKAYATTEPTANQMKVTVCGPTGAALYTFNADKTAAINFGTADSNGNIVVTIGGKSYTVNSTSAYKNTAWTIGSKANEDRYSGESEDYTVEKLAQSLNKKELIIYPVTELQATKTYTISALGDTAATINLNGADQEGTSVSGVKYDDRVRVTYTEDATKGTLYGLVINEAELAGGTVARYVPISYGNNYAFHANSQINFYPLYVKTVVSSGMETKVYYVDDENDTRITSAETLYRLQHHLPFVINMFDTQNVSGKYIFRSLFTANLPSDVKITEHGRVNFSTTDQAAAEALEVTEKDCVIGWSKEYNGKTYSTSYKAASSYDNESHQYSFRSTVPSSGFKFVIARGYVKYEYNFTQEEKDADGNVIKTVSAPIEAVEYGRADTYYYPSN